MMRLPTRVEMLVTRVNELPNSSSGTWRDTFWRLKSGVSSVVEGIGALVGLMASFRAWLDCLLAPNTNPRMAFFASYFGSGIFRLSRSRSLLKAMSSDATGFTSSATSSSRLTRVLPGAASAAPTQNTSATTATAEDLLLNGFMVDSDWYLVPGGSCPEASPSKFDS
uniref:(northern house mosquito) hypothetical protein n=1 Tax=Culex pipiens TaxID=7175 RepID=A0A8D8GRG3_CULPI